MYWSGKEVNLKGNNENDSLSFLTDLELCVGSN